MREMTAIVACTVALVIGVTAFAAMGRAGNDEALRDLVSDLLDSLDADESIEEEVMREAVNPCILAHGRAADPEENLSDEEVLEIMKRSNPGAVEGLKRAALDTVKNAMRPETRQLFYKALIALCLERIETRAR